MSQEKKNGEDLESPEVEDKLTSEIAEDESSLLDTALGDVVEHDDSAVEHDDSALNLLDDTEGGDTVQIDDPVRNQLGLFYLEHTRLHTPLFPMGSVACSM